MLVFIDESGHPHPNDTARRPVVTAVCLSDRDSRRVSGRVHALKRDFLGRERMELKGRNLINRPTFQRKPEINQFLDEFFSTVLNLPITIFAMIMEAPFNQPVNDSNLLPNRFRYLVQRKEPDVVPAGNPARFLSLIFPRGKSVVKPWRGGIGPCIRPRPGLMPDGRLTRQP